MIRAARFAMLACITLLGLMLASLWAAPVRGETVQCMWVPMPALSNRLATKYDQWAINVGVVGDGDGLLSIFASHAGTFTVVLTDPAGQGCIIIVGNGLQTMALPPEGSLN